MSSFGETSNNHKMLGGSRLTPTLQIASVEHMGSTLQTAPSNAYLPYCSYVPLDKILFCYLIIIGNL